MYIILIYRKKLSIEPVDLVEIAQTHNNLSSFFAYTIFIRKSLASFVDKIGLFCSISLYVFSY